MTFQFDFSKDKPDNRELIPAGTVVFVEHIYTPGGADVPGTLPDKREGALTASKNTDALYLKSEFTILRGPYKGRKFWGNLTVYGGKLDEKGRSVAGGITRKNIRLMLDSSLGLSSKDESPEASAKRVISGFRDLQKRRFIAKVAIEKGKDGYADKNGLGQILTIDMKGYPQSEAELDNPTVNAVPADAPPAPAWGSSHTDAAPTENAAGRQTAGAWGQTQPQPVGGQPAQAADPAPTEQTAENVPLWARPAA
jgi:hypothetical protein